MTIKHDVSTVSIVSTCTECPRAWWAFNFDREHAFTSGENHLINAHGVEPNKAGEARRSFDRRKRHAADA